MPVGVALSPLACVLAFDGNNRIAVRRRGSTLDLPFIGPDLETVEGDLKGVFSDYSSPTERFQADVEAGPLRVHFTEIEGAPADPEIEMRSADWLDSARACLAPSLAGVLTELNPHLIEVPYLKLGENDYIYKFRPERERNNAIYARDAEAGAIYQSRLCSAIKALARRHERSATNPVTLDFGAVRYLVPSHFGFCLGVKNAIERAYETLIENPGKRVFMLSELIHNPFVNEDLIRRGLRYLQSDKGIPYTDGPGGPQLWDTLTSDDVVIIPAFGATDEDKRRLVRKGIAIRQYDATCMLVEKVWKAARAYGREGYTVIIHGKHEHEETKATFSNTRRYAPAIIVRNIEEARLLGEIILKADGRSRAKFASLFDGKLTPGFDFDRDLQRVAVVNQTTLLVNETREIIAHMRQVFAEKYGDEVSGARPRIGGHDRTDTLCYATQVNQDALARALSEPLDAAFVVGGKNSSNTYQLYRLCEQYLGDRAFFIQSEANILSEDEAENYVFPAKGRMGPGGHHERKALWMTPRDKDLEGPRRVLITGGASCPDGIIQQVIFRLNSFYPRGELRDIEAVLADLAGG
ncbi:MAG TPA: 4-hydroxy-3-methylbut-2-enyl diphosphate reductase [Opitutaceae bacterium]|jgi:4-hydroxy-3-methylbut-2-enyl diphosphate reductase